LPGVEVQVAADDAVLVRTSAMATRYLDAPGELESARSPEGFLHTGERGRLVGRRLLLRRDPGGGRGGNW
jgi:long-subunit acyl-CoA synthetase (AMP-forming)